jgi:hypothetical protein
MITDNFKIFIEALEALPEDIRNNHVDMKSIDEPVCGTPGCFAGLVSIVANDIQSSSQFRLVEPQSQIIH